MALPRGGFLMRLIDSVFSTRLMVLHSMFQVMETLAWNGGC